MLEKKGVDLMFGYPGGSVIPIYDELYDADIRHVLVRHEQCAAHMADGYARASGRPGVCLATSGPGATNLVTGIATAFADSIPMIALTGQVGTGSLGLGAFQEVDAYSLLMPITKHNFRVLDSNRLPHAISEAWEICQMGRPGPVHIDLPVDQMNSNVDECHLDEEYGVKPLREDLSGMDQAVRWIRESKRPVILVGGGAVNAYREVREFAEMLRAPVDMTLMGMGVVPSSHELNMGPLGMHGRMAAKTVMNESDLVISIGSRFSDRTYSNKSRMQSERGRVIHIDVDAIEFGKHKHHDCVNLQGDSARVIRMLMGALGGTYRANPEWTSRGIELKRRCTCNPDVDACPILPQKVITEINRIMRNDTIVTTDVGQNQMWAMHYLNVDHPRQLLSSGTFGTMGFGLPSAIGAKAARPESDVIAITGDGGLLMVMQELATSLAEDLPVTIVVLNNGVLGMVRQWQKLFWDQRYSETTLNQVDFVKMAEAFGARGMRVEKPGEIGDALREATECGRTCLIDVVVDTNEDVLPMLPADPKAALVQGRCGFF